MAAASTIGQVRDVFPKLGELTDKVVFGDVWERKGLSKRDRSLVTVAALTALYRPDQLRGHMWRALDNGVTRDEIIELITHLASIPAGPMPEPRRSSPSRSSKSARHEDRVHRPGRHGPEPLALFKALRQGALGRKRTFDRLPEHFLPGKYDPAAFTVRLAHKHVTLVLDLARGARGGQRTSPGRAAGRRAARLGQAAVNCPSGIRRCWRVSFVRLVHGRRRAERGQGIYRRVGGLRSAYPRDARQ